MAVVLVGIVLASREPGRGPARGMLAAGAGLGLVSAVCLGFFYVAFDAASEGSVGWAVLMQRSTFVALVLPVVFVLRRRLSLPGRHVPAVILIGLLDVGALAFLAEATTRGLVSVVSVIASLYPVTTVVLAHLLLGERIAPSQRAGVVGAFAGVALVTAG
jgi:drug/metabolite transporter (DMT)-like permease